MRTRRTRLPRWLGALLTPAEDPRGWAAPPPPGAADVLLADLRRSRAELAQLSERLAQSGESHEAWLRELREQEQDLLAAELRLGQAIDQRLAAEALERARRTALEAELHVDD
jgi:hypothetical protein